MATAVQISVEEYLRTNYRPDREFLDGEVVERSMPNSLHAPVPIKLGHFFYSLNRDLYAATELRMQVEPGRYRVADFALYSDTPTEKCPSAPGLVIAEVLSPDDRSGSVHDKLMEYERWGVSHIWLVDPEAKRLFVFKNGSLHLVNGYSVPELDCELQSSDILPT